MTHTCLHCDNPVPADDATVCGCDLTPGVHIICVSCRANRPTIRVDWTSPLNRARLDQTSRVFGPSMLQQAARGHA